LRFTDLDLPGEAGRDLVFQRTYRTDGRATEEERRKPATVTGWHADVGITLPDG
jgi:hypothetical protein